MKLLVSITIIFVIIVNIAFSQDLIPIIKIEKTFDFGIIEKNSEGIGEIKFQNIGKSPLVITNISSSCGCTTPSWPKEPVLPGDSGLVLVKYDTRRVGIINKQITISCNATEPNIIIQIKGNVMDTPENNIPQKTIDRTSVPVSF